LAGPKRRNTEGPGLDKTGMEHHDGPPSDDPVAVAVEVADRLGTLLRLVDQPAVDDPVGVAIDDLMLDLTDLPE
jgi:hypothetical protein